jgi:hypothetical protein
MATSALNSRVQSLVTEYGVFSQFWPQFEQTHGERRLVGFGVESIGSHTSDLNHVDPACRTCRHVRSVLLAIADLMPGELTLRRNALTYKSNFTAQLGGGVQVFSSTRHRSLDVGCKYHHILNTNLGNVNHGMDSLTLFFGVSFFR